MSSNQRIASFDIARVIALIAVVIIHGQFFSDYAFAGDEPWFNYLANQLSRFAVPLFFLMAGYLIYPNLVANPLQKARSYTLPLMVIWLIWSLISLAMPFNLANVMEYGYLGERMGYWGFLASTPLNSLLEGGLVHLWFIPSLVIAVWMIAALVKFGEVRILLPLAAALYVYGLGAGSYAIVTEWTAPVFTRNGPFFSLLMVGLGFEIRRNQWLLSSTQALMLALVGLALHMGEAWYLHTKGLVFNMNDFLFGTALWSTGLFMWLLANPNAGSQSKLASFAPWVFPVYVVHLLVVIFCFNVAGILGLQQFSKDVLVLVGTLLGSLALVKGLERTPLSFSRLRKRFN